VFRKKSLEKMMHPDSLDQLLVVVTPQAVLTLGTLALVLVIGIVWSIVAEIPVTIDGNGILLKPHSLKTIQASGAGLLTDIRIAVGQTVSAGETIAKIEQPELERQLEQETARYRSIREFNDQALDLAVRKRIVDNEHRTDPRESTVRQLQDKITSRSVELSVAQNENLENTRRMLVESRRSQSEQLKNITELVAKGIVADAQRLSAQTALNEIDSRLADVDVRVRQNSMSRLDAEQTGLRRTQELETQDSQLAANIRILKERLHRQSHVRTQFGGHVLEVGSSVGQMISAGQRLFILQAEPQEPFHRVELGSDVSRGQFQLVVGDTATVPLDHNASGEQVQRALAVLPSLLDYQVTVSKAKERPIYDVRMRSMQAGNATRPRIEARDSGLADAQNVPGFAAVFELGDRIEDEDLKHLSFFPIGQGKRVRPGMAIRVNPTSVERQRYGSIMGVVTKVSEFPVTAEGVVNMIGNTDVAKSLLERGGAMLVEAEMTKDSTNPTGLKWTSKGPDLPMTSGTTTTCRVTLETRAPITFALPLLRSWLLGDADKQPAR
jgi:HlyD family secretion protein